MIKQFFDRPRVDIERELDEYIKMRQPVEPEFAHGEEEEEDFITDDVRSIFCSLIFCLANSSEITLHYNKNNQTYKMGLPMSAKF